MDFSGYGRVLRSRVLPVVAAALVIAATGGGAHAGDAPGYDRPGYGFDPTPLAPGGFAFEQGLPTWTLDHDGGVRSSQYVTDSLLRVGLGADMELQLGGAPFARLDQRGAGTVRGHGDDSLGLKLGLPSGKADWSWGLLGTVEFTDGTPGLRNDRRQYTLGLVAQQQLDETRQWSYYAQMQRTGDQNGLLAAADYGYAINDRWSIYGEAAAQHDGGRNGLQLGNGLTWLPNPRLQFDAWWRRRVAGHADDWEAGFGVAVAFGG
jgi:hypothetical protein